MVLTLRKYIRPTLTLKYLLLLEGPVSSNFRLGPFPRRDAPSLSVPLGIMFRHANPLPQGSALSVYLVRGALYPWWFLYPVPVFSYKPTPISHMNDGLQSPGVLSRLTIERLRLPPKEISTLTAEPAAQVPTPLEREFLQRN